MQVQRETLEAREGRLKILNKNNRFGSEQFHKLTHFRSDRFRSESFFDVTYFRGDRDAYFTDHYFDQEIF